jgi:hypothetical protein
LITACGRATETRSSDASREFPRRRWPSRSPVNNFRLGLVGADEAPRIANRHFRLGDSPSVAANSACRSRNVRPERNPLPRLSARSAGRGYELGPRRGPAACACILLHPC